MGRSAGFLQHASQHLRGFGSMQDDVLSPCFGLPSGSLATISPCVFAAIVAVVIASCARRIFLAKSEKRFKAVRSQEVPGKGFDRNNDGNILCSEATDQRY